MTFGTALVIEVDIARGIEPLVLGVYLTAINVAIIGVLLYSNTGRYLKQQKERDRKEACQAQCVEWAVGFDKKKFKTTLHKVEKEFVPRTHALTYQYCSLSDANAAIRSGIPALASDAMSGVVVTLHRPHELDELDLATFTKREAVLACAVPWHLLKPIESAYTVVGKKCEIFASSPSALCVLPVEVLAALRGSYFGDLVDAQPWYQGGILLPARQIVRAYLLKEEGRQQEKVYQATTDDDSGHPVRDQPFANVELMHSPAMRPSVCLDRTGVVTPSTCLQFANHMSRIRTVCKDKGWEVLYHYTQSDLFPLIQKMGFRMSTQGQGDGGVYFSTLGPAAYALGTDLYEENIIVNCFGPERLDEYKGKGMLDLCLVYGADPRVLRQAPGER